MDEDPSANQLRQRSPWPAKAIKQYGQAALRDPSNALVFLLLGQTYAAIGETEAAVRQWTAATELSPSWAVPYGLISRTQSATGNYADALRNAEGRKDSASVRSLRGDNLRRCLVRPFDAQRIDQRSQRRQGVIAATRNDPNDLARRTHDAPALCRGPRAQWQRRSRKIRDRGNVIAGNQTPLPTLLQLAAVSRQHELDQESAILDAAEKTFGSQPAIASARATAQSARHGDRSTRRGSHAGDVA